MVTRTSTHLSDFFFNGILSLGACHIVASLIRPERQSSCIRIFHRMQIALRSLHPSLPDTHQENPSPYLFRLNDTMATWHFIDQSHSDAHRSVTKIVTASAADIDSISDPWIIRDPHLERNPNRCQRSLIIQAHISATFGESHRKRRVFDFLQDRHKSIQEFGEIPQK